MSSEQHRDLDLFLDTVAEFTAAQFRIVSDEAREIGSPVRSAARKAARLPAAEFSALDKRVRDTLRGLHDELSASGAGAVSAAVSDTLGAAHGILRRDRITEDEYHALVGPFVAAGAELPPHSG